MAPRRYLIITGCWLLWGLFNVSRLHIAAPGITWGEALLYGLPDGLLWALLTPIPVALARRFPLPAPQVLRNVSIHLIAGSAVAVAHSQLDALLSALYGFLATGDANLSFLARKILVYGFHLNLVIYLVIAGVAMYLGRLRNLREREQQAARLRTQLSEARLTALRAQIRPHFLFNALHTVGALIEGDRAASRRVLRQLGDLLRASLSIDGDHQIPLRREIALCRDYLEIEKARFGDRLSVSIDLDKGAADCAIPTLLLQPLVENAVRHGIERLTAPGTVRVVVRRNGERVEVTVKDTGPGPAGTLHGTGIGLASVRERLQEHYGDDHSCEIESSSGFSVKLNIPYRAVSTISVAPTTAVAERQAS